MRVVDSWGYVQDLFLPLVSSRQRLSKKIKSLIWGGKAMKKEIKAEDFNDNELDDGLCHCLLPEPGMGFASLTKRGYYCKKCKRFKEEKQK